MPKKYDPWESLRNAVLDAQERVKHYKSDNFMQIMPVPAAGVEIPQNANSLTSYLGPWNVREGSVISYTISSDSNTTDICRVVGIAKTNGVGDVLDPPHLAVLVLSCALDQIYLRLVHPKNVCMVAADAAVFLARWFFSDSNAFELSKLNLVLMNMDYGVMNARNIKSCLDSAGNLVPSPLLSYYEPLFSRVKRYFGAGFRIRQTQHNFEVWLAEQGYVETTPNVGVVTAANMLKVYLDETPTFGWERELLEQLAEVIGTLRREQ